MARRIFDPLKKAGVKLNVTSFNTGAKILTDSKVKAAKMGVTMASLLTAAIIRGSPQVKTKKDVIHIICEELGLNEEEILKYAEEQLRGSPLTKSKDTKEVNE
jgi:hypothetical protein